MINVIWTKMWSELQSEIRPWPWSSTDPDSASWQLLRSLMVLCDSVQQCDVLGPENHLLRIPWLHVCLVDRAALSSRIVPKKKKKTVFNNLLLCVFLVSICIYSHWPSCLCFFQSVAILKPGLVPIYLDKGLVSFATSLALPRWPLSRLTCRNTREIVLFIKQCLTSMWFKGYMFRNTTFNRSSTFSFIYDT